MTAIDESASTDLTAQEHEWVNQFMDDTTIFLGPDPAIMRDHSISGRTPLEDRCIAKGLDSRAADRIRKRLEGALDEGYEMIEAMGAAPGAKWVTNSCRRATGRQMGRGTPISLHWRR